MNAFRSRVYVRLTFDEKVALTKALVPPYRPNYDYYVLQRLDTWDGIIHFNEDIEGSYFYHLGSTWYKSITCRLWSSIVHRLLDRGYIDRDGRITQEGRNAYPRMRKTRQPRYLEFLDEI